jgi:hypothetical protein
MAKIVITDRLTLSSLFVEALFGDEPIGIATSIVWSTHSQLFLVTNWHVASGLHPETGQPISRSGSTPDRLVVQIRHSDNMASLSGLEIPLHDRQGRPVWLEHANHGSKVDVAAIPIKLDDTARVFPINEFEYADFRFEVSQEVFIIGFPRGITSAGGLPIWKKASIASEPYSDLHGLPKLLVDSATREGMSGSPAIAQYVGVHAENPPKLGPDDWFGQGRRFLGIYSGRTPTSDELDAQLGYVWKANAIEEIVSDGLRPD